MTKIIQIKQTRIQREKRLLIQKAALQVFSEFGLRGATLDKIAKACGLTKPNILYYYSSKDEIYAEVLQSLLDEWIRPLKDISENGDPLTEILKYVQKKLTMSKKKKQERKLIEKESFIKRRKNKKVNFLLQRYCTALLLHKIYLLEV